jgi:hypothetical protein
MTGYGASEMRAFKDILLDAIELLFSQPSRPRRA